MKSSIPVSIVICCHNSVQRLPKTLSHLLCQDTPVGLDWEVVIVDNASVDETAQVALSLWPGDAPAPLRVVSEPEAGLTNARKCGFHHARYELVSFVDDDNWVSPNWVRHVSQIMSYHLDVGACGGRTEPVFEVEPPAWFDEFKHHFAIGNQGEKPGDVTWTRGHLWGAGLTIRKHAREELTEEGFKPILSGRCGRILTSGEDYELCYALRLAGWRLWYEPELCLKHFIPASRLKWSYLRKLYRGHGATRVGFEPYEFTFNRSYDHLIRIARRIWVWQATKTLGKLILWHGADWIRSIWSDMEGNPRILGAEYQLGRLIEMLRKRKEYDKSVTTVWKAKWNRTSFKVKNV